MHRPRSHHMARSMKLGAWLLYLFFLSSLAFTIVLIYVLVQDKRELLPYTFAILACDLAFLISFRLTTSSTRCPLCMAQIYRSRSCQRNQRARKVFGSYRLRVAGSIILTNAFICPYCGEPTKCIPRIQAK